MAAWAIKKGRKTILNLCYTLSMQGRNHWVEWSTWLESRGLAEPAAVFLDAAGPLHLLLAQTIYLVQPFLGNVMQPEESLSLAELFEDRLERQSFAALLRQEATHS
jgi:hypothetical protein